ncbi:MAG TPA: hypothetical protein VGC41_27190, partial [Kofleriaceae bacterium]
ASLLLLTAIAHADPEINLAVSGSIDAGVVATSIATELSRPISPQAANTACHAPCLAIAIAGKSATVTFTTATGGTRQRTIELGNDRAQWPELVTLLAGNLVRDDAEELLPSDPAPTVVETAPAPPEQETPPALVVAPAAVVLQARPPVPEHHSFASIGLIPGLSTDLLDIDRSHTISIGLVAGSSGEVRGAAISGAIDVARRVAGVQISGAVAVAGELTGVQIAGAVTVSDRSRGTQLAGAIAFARDAHVQIAGAMNIATRVDGVQIAPFNIARRNDGVQIGVLNIGGGPDAEAFGLINIVPGGRTDLEASVDSDGIGAVMFRHGGKHWHNVYGVGGQHHSDTEAGANNDVWMYGLGFGPSFKIMNLPADLEAIGWHVSHGSNFGGDLSLLAQLRLSVGIPFGPVTLVAGGAINTFVSDDHASPLFSARVNDYPMDSSTVVRVWPSVFVGARI